MPDPTGQVFRPVEIPSLPPLPLDPPPLQDFVPTQCLTLDRLEKILSSVPKGFLQPQELDLLVFILQNQQKALAFEDSERGNVF